MNTVRLESVSKVYGKGEQEVAALHNVSMQFTKGSFTALMGPSGSGKSTFLQCAAGLDQPTSGTVYLEEQEISGLDETALSELRRERIGFVFQSYNLLPVLTVQQNAALPLRLAGRKPSRAQLNNVLEQVGLTQRKNHRPAELSGGQQQRVAIARALISEPAVIFADEPTGALDTGSAREILSLLQHSAQVQGRTIIMVTHDPVAASYADRVIFLADGQLAGELENPTPEAVAERLTHLGESAFNQAAN
ncbi:MULTISPECIES: ABC transporter ATP-binding protein [Glutamicibacter]|uniref:ABC transporter ATP-binding protein n=1 Tax=Glutamicibacter TaxID=1742989 RepID=UPI0021C7950C|nr:MULTISPECIES: ABC transporter ATP-binding protein [unclassified Glutamicibacter]UXN31835.1 ABC transporter ATP-binding protein [Glutamicibacter sp. M10]